MEQNPLFSSVPERWSEIRDFPSYSVSDWGNVRNEKTGRLITPTRNSRNVSIVGLMGVDKKQQKRSLPLLVANAFVPSTSNHFDTPINLDGNLENNHYLNLAWRPLWFARKYKKQFEKHHASYPYPIEDVETHVIYDNSREAAIKHGLLEMEIRLSMLNNTYVWPTGQIFCDAQ